MSCETAICGRSVCERFGAPARRLAGFPGRVRVGAHGAAIRPPRKDHQLEGTINRSKQLAAVAVLALAAAATGCATAFRHGNGLTTKVPENGREVRVIAMNMSHATQDLEIYEGNQRLTIAKVRDHIWANATHNAVAEEGARSGASVGCSGVCPFSWTERTSYGPGLFLDPGRPHTLRLVRGGREVTVTVGASMRPKRFVRDMFLFALAPVGWIVDASTGMWKGFPRLDVDRAFGAASGSRRPVFPSRSPYRRVREMENRMRAVV